MRGPKGKLDAGIEKKDRIGAVGVGRVSVWNFGSLIPRRHLGGAR